MTKTPEWADKAEETQALYAKGGKVVAETLNTVCPHCGKLRIPTIERAMIGGRVRLWPHFDPCGCVQGAVAAEKAAKSEEQRKIEEAKAMLRAALARAGLSRLMGCTLENYKAREDWDKARAMAVSVRRYVDAVLTTELMDKPWLVLHGKPGMGKTHLAAAAVHLAVVKGLRESRFVVWNEHTQRLGATFDREADESSDRVRAEIQAAPLLAVDDIDKQVSSEYWREELFTLLNHRYNAKLPTILTFNHGLREQDENAPGMYALVPYVGTYLLDRIIERTWAVLAFDGPSYRSGVRWQNT